MELPFAVDYSAASTPLKPTPSQPALASKSHATAESFSTDDDDSLVIASSQGSLMPSEATFDYKPGLSKNTESTSPFSVDSQIIRLNAPHQIYNQNDHDEDGFNQLLSQFGVAGPSQAEEAEFTYVTVGQAEDDDMVLAGDDDGLERDDENLSKAPCRKESEGVLALLLTGPVNREADALLNVTEQASRAVEEAAEAKKQGNLQHALDAHTLAANLFKQAATAVKDKDVALAHSLLLLSQTHAKAGLALKRIVKLHPSNIVRDMRDQWLPTTTISDNTQKDRLRATVRGALDNRPHQADISNSTFLGWAPAKELETDPPTASSLPVKGQEQHQDSTTSTNPVDEMMQLEKELNSMDMALSMCNSIASLDVRTQSRLKHSMIDGSFMVVQPDSNANVCSTSHQTTPPRETYGATTGTTNARARANRVQTILDATTTAARPLVAPAPLQQSATGRSMQLNNQNGSGLESSWLGSNASHMLASSIISMGTSVGGRNHISSPGSANSKQLLRLMDSLKTLGDENAALLREVQDAEKARKEAYAAKEQMRRFKNEYAKKFGALKEALENVRKNHAANADASNPVLDSEFIRTSGYVQEQEQRIRKLTDELAKEKDDNKKKDATLRKYETFYREVKMRSAQKAAQRQKETAQQQRQLPPAYRPVRKEMHK
ncbi:hypothetical protein MPSEU_001066700 [Mayamaea pseudoterrestris]|nr:hypothetical protein MPSEU_001066700 [Mayamaea pseudoterrestris]